MKIEKWADKNSQSSQIGESVWSVSRLIELSKDLAVFDAQLDCLDVSKTYNDIRMRDFVMHMNAVLEADLDFPIILDEDGEIMDGRHRVMKAMHLGKKTIKAVRFDENPTPCRYKKEGDL